MGPVKYTGEACDACKAPIMVIMTRGNPWKFCVNIECPKREKKVKKGAVEDQKVEDKKAIASIKAKGKKAPAKKTATKRPAKAKSAKPAVKKKNKVADSG
jgi:hypothetical protein